MDRQEGKIFLLTLALFGEAEKGAFRSSYLCSSLDELAQKLGNPPEDSAGLHFAIQALMHNNPVLFYRVEEEGVSLPDYIWGLENLKESTPMIGAIALPGLGDVYIYDKAVELAYKAHVPLLLREEDFYDYLTDR